MVEPTVAIIATGEMGGPGGAVRGKIAFTSAAQAPIATKPLICLNDLIARRPRIGAVRVKTVDWHLLNRM